MKSTFVNLTRSFFDPVSSATLAACFSASSRRLLRALALNGSWLASYRFKGGPERDHVNGSSSTWSFRGVVKTPYRTALQNMVCVTLQCDANAERTRRACLKGRNDALFVKRRATWKWRGSSRNTTIDSTPTGSLRGLPPLQDDARGEARLRGSRKIMRISLGTESKVSRAQDGQSWVKNRTLELPVERIHPRAV